MIVFGTLKTEDSGKILFQGSKKECNDYASTLDLNSFYSLNIDTDDGVIEDRIVSSGDRFFRVKDYMEENPGLEVRLDAKDSMDECDQMINPFWKGQAKDIPEEWHDKFVLSAGWMMEAQVNALSVYAPDMMNVRLQLEETQAVAPQIRRHRGR